VAKTTILTKVFEILKKFLSRKLIVWVVATVFFAMHNLDSSEWFGITMTYLGIQGGADVMTRFRNKEPISQEKKDG